MSFKEYINNQLQTLSDYEKQLDCRMYIKFLMRETLDPCQQCSTLNHTTISLDEAKKIDLLNHDCPHKHGCGLLLQGMSERKYLREYNPKQKSKPNGTSN